MRLWLGASNQARTVNGGMPRGSRTALEKGEAVLFLLVGPLWLVNAGRWTAINPISSP